MVGGGRLKYLVLVGTFIFAPFSFYINLHSALHSANLSQHLLDSFLKANSCKADKPILPDQECVMVGRHPLKTSGLRIHENKPCYVSRTPSSFCSAVLSGKSLTSQWRQRSVRMGKYNHVTDRWENLIVCFCESRAPLLSLFQV